ncbi:MAG: YcjF family protein [Muribaculaceae bacterium]|nr:YcjF family protein [Muribaculaceae bacterium]
MSKRNLILIIVFIVIMIAMMMTGNVIIVSQRLAQAVQFPALEYIIYGVILIFFIYIFIVPIVRIHSTPELPPLSVAPDENIAQLKRLAQSLANSMDYISDPQARSTSINSFRRSVAMAGNNANTLTSIIETEIAKRFEGDENINGINKHIINWAVSTFVITAVSQNGIFDTISVVYLNIRMIADIVRASGFKPTRRQMVKIYCNVLITSVTSFALSNALDGMGDFSPFAALGDDNAADSPYSILNNLKIPGFVMGSAIDGATNALMTLRIGYITASYIRDGANAFHGLAAKRAVKRQAMKKAFTSLPTVIGAGSSVIGKTAASALLRIFKST